MPQIPTTILAAPGDFAFGRFCVSPSQRLLSVDGEAAKLGARAFDVLLTLIERRERVVSKNELLDIVWPHLVVEENNLQVQISALRKLLGPGAIATVPGRGYRFALPIGAPVEVSLTPATPAPPSASTPAPARPAPHSPPLYGRAHEQQAVQALLRSERVVSVVGAGGIGKTRLAQTVAAQVLAEFEDGVCWVDLAAISDPLLLAAAVARVLGVTLSEERTATDAVLATLAPQHRLLVLDNCEHLIDAAAGFVETLAAAAPRVQMLLTSQEPLKTAEEHVYRLGTLAVPPTDTVEGAGQFGAVELFAARARAADPRFELNADTLPAAVDICRRLDGIALAIELAVARLPLLGIEGLRARLDERFKLLTAGARIVLRRHQTLRAALEWSYGLLKADEQMVLRRLGVFAGSFAMESAQRVAGDAGHDAWAVLDHLGALVDKSLVLADDGAVPRYRLLETTRAFALEQLALAGETEVVLQRHAEALLALLTASATGPLRWRRTPAIGQACAAELDNLRAALAWAGAPGRSPALALALAGVSPAVWGSAGSLFVEGLQRCLALRPRVGPDIQPEVAAAFWLAIASLGLYVAHPESFEAAARAAALYRTLGDASRLYDALVARAFIGSRRGEQRAVEEALGEAIAIEDAAWPPRQRASMRLAQQGGALMAGHYEEALAFGWQQATLYLEEALPIGEQLAIGNIAGAELALGRFDAAEYRLRPALDRLRQLGAEAAGGHLRAGLMNALAGLGRYDDATEEARRAMKLLRPEGDETRLLVPLALIAARTGRHADAARIAGRADRALALRGEVPRPFEAQRRATLAALLSEALSAPERTALEAAGAAMSQDEIFALAFGRQGSTP